MTDDQAALAKFDGTARLFPMPNLVFFPHVVQGLHIFESRYRQMAADAIADDQLIAIVLLRGDWENDYDASPEIETVACLGRITGHELMPDGRYNLLLKGCNRFLILKENHTRITHVHLKDRKANNGPGMPWGQGDTPLKEILRLMKTEQYKFQATIELEYPLPPGSNTLTELAKCVDYCREVLSA